MISAFILIVADLSGVRLVNGVFCIGVGGVGRDGVVDGGCGVDAGGGPEGVPVEQGLGVGGKVGDCSGGGVGVEKR